MHRDAALKVRQSIVGAPLLLSAVRYSGLTATVTYLPT